MLERELKHSQAASQRTQEELRALRSRQSRDRLACDASAEVLAPAAVRAVVRDALRKMADWDDTPAAADAKQDGLPAAYVELVRVELAEGLALEDSGWCRCPPLPDLRRLCRAIATVSRAGGSGSRQGDDESEKARSADTAAAGLAGGDVCAAETARLQDVIARTQQLLLSCEDDLELSHRRLRTVQQTTVAEQPVTAASPPPLDASRCAPFVK
jgi:hypothetical protein